MDRYMPSNYRQCIAMYADDMAAGADTLEELFELYKALVTALDKAVKNIAWITLTFHYSWRCSYPSYRKKLENSKNSA
jgi:hypothetical protein